MRFWIEITKEEYEAYKNNTVDRDKWLDEKIDFSRYRGYGVYPRVCYSETGQYFITYTTGDSCD